MLQKLHFGCWLKSITQARRPQLNSVPVQGVTLGVMLNILTGISFY
jgi:hypothetical protein